VTEAFRTVGIDIGGTAIKIALVWNDGRVVRAERVPTLAADGPQAAAERIIACVDALLRAEATSPAELRAVGVDSAGIVDGARNVVLDAPNLRSWEGFPLAARVGAHFGLPAFLENDVNAMAYGEWRCGAGRGTRHLVCLTLGTGVGGGLVLDGKLYRGAHGAAGEIGHMSLDRNGPRCACGSFGCLERYVGAAHLVARALEFLRGDARASRLRDVPPERLQARDVGEAAAAGDALAHDILAETGRWLGVGLAGVVNLLDPERIVIGGGVARAGAPLFDAARAMIRERAMSLPAHAVEVVPAALGDDAAVVGAALLAQARLAAS
jgi:glucokinase